MESQLVWQYGSNSPNNSDNLETIRRWWGKLAGKEILWQQRLLPDGGNSDDLDWEPQRFDDRFAMTDPELKGITIYWRKPEETDTHNITARQFELDESRQQLYIYPKSQPKVVLRVAVPTIVYESLEVKPSALNCVAGDGKALLVLRDESQRLEVTVKLDGTLLDKLKSQLS
ncbi:hypothetical protein [Baaleninema simplex]|uniref:hypothetical protein n=1 Tax=Baaleninema simplex TaxID=2862350 RepID=UPI000349F866|nr:hypothetical protein [Baaleninema simplex]